MNGVIGKLDFINILNFWSHIETPAIKHDSPRQTHMGRVLLAGSSVEISSVTEHVYAHDLRLAETDSKS